MADLLAPSSATAMSQMQQAALDRVRDAATPARGGKIDLVAIRKAANDFEAVFATEMVSHMFEGVGANNPFGGGHGEEVFRSLMIDQYGKAIAQQGTLGIADQVAAEMIKMQEAKR